MTKRCGQVNTAKEAAKLPQKKAKPLILADFLNA
jgi:hypothetical protein